MKHVNYGCSIERETVFDVDTTCSSFALLLSAICIILCNILFCRRDFYAPSYAFGKLLRRRFSENCKFARADKE